MNTLNTIKNMTDQFKGEKDCRFCPHCGAKVGSTAKFCGECGESIMEPSYSKPARDPEPDVVYEGTLHKCPNCGKLMRSFATHCPICGYEVRDAKSSSAVKELAVRLSEIEAKQMPEIHYKRSVLSMLVGDRPKDRLKAEEAKNEFKAQKDKEKANLITNYPIPNAREDMLEFLILASANIDAKSGTNDIVTQAWIAKMKQIYKRAELAMGETADFEELRNIYVEKMTEINIQKSKLVSKRIAIIAACCFMIGLIGGLKTSISLCAMVLVVGIFIVRAIRNRDL